MHAVEDVLEAGAGTEKGIAEGEAVDGIHLIGPVPRMLVLGEDNSGRGAVAAGTATVRVVSVLRVVMAAVAHGGWFC